MLMSFAFAIVTMLAVLACQTVLKLVQAPAEGVERAFS
jgi:hypothetical protein